MVAKAAALAQRAKRFRAVALAALLALYSPYPVRFAIEDKSYALLVLLVALALLPALAWIAHASPYLLSSRSGSWIGAPVYAGVAVPIAHQLVGCWLSRVLAMAGATLINRGPQVCGSISIVSKA